jgi:hypothetical protein
MDDSVSVHERIPPDEAVETKRLIDRLRDMMSARDRGGTQGRDVHVKMHGVMRAEFTVAGDLPPDLRVGLFAQPATYKAWVRFSNSANAVKPDAKGDIRGMAIKLMGVPGRKLLQAEADGGSQDLILISAANFPSSTPGQFDALVAAVIGSLWDKLWYFLTHPRVAWMLLTTMVRHANVLQIRYFSAVPYAFGALAVKYVATPRVATPKPMPSSPPDNFLRQVAAAQLDKGDAVFDFAVQFQRDEASMPIEDPSRAWSLALSPPRKVATLRILQQAFDTEAINAFGENLSFTPWHCLPEHRPLGGINRVRKLIYETLSAFRHDANHAPQREPVDWHV